MTSVVIIFLAMMIPLIWSPGPNNIMCATVGARQGTAGSVPFIAGLNLPILFYALLTGFGLAVLINNIPAVEPVLTVLGSLYVIYLGITLFKISENDEVNSIHYGFKSGFIISSLNFKVVTVLILMYSQFSSPNILYTAGLAIAFVSICIIGHFIWNFLGQIAATLIKNEIFLRAQSLIYGLMLIGVGIWMLIPQFKIFIVG